MKTKKLRLINDAKKNKIKIALAYPKRKKKAQMEFANGSQFNIFTFMIVAFLAVVFFGGLIYAMGLINNVMNQVGIANEVNAGKDMYVNMSQASITVFGSLNQSIQALRLVALMYILGIGVCIMLTNALQKKHPIFFFIYIMISLLAVIFAPAISNAYITLLNSGIYEGGLNQFTGANVLILNLPIVVLVISVLGGVFLFINLIRTGGESEIY